VVTWIQRNIDQVQSIWTFVDDHPPDGNSVELNNPTSGTWKLLAITSFLRERLLLQELGQHFCRQSQCHEFRGMHSGIQSSQKGRIRLETGTTDQTRTGINHGTTPHFSISGRQTSALLAHEVEAKQSS
jgi:hypothetical protein